MKEETTKNLEQEFREELSKNGFEFCADSIVNTPVIRRYKRMRFIWKPPIYKVVCESNAVSYKISDKIDYQRVQLLCLLLINPVLLIH